MEKIECSELPKVPTDFWSNLDKICIILNVDFIEIMCKLLLTIVLM